MAFEVRISARARRDIDRIVEDTRQAWSEEQAIRWGRHLLEDLFSLEHFPRRCRLARTATASREIRVLDIGRGRNRILAYYQIVGEELRILRLIHSRRDERL